MFTINQSSEAEHLELINIWEDSVRATHHFLKEEDIQLFKHLIQEKYLMLVTLYCLRNDENKIIGFMGVSEDNLEMLFIHSNAIGQGIGKLLLNHAINHLNITKVDVNEQNEQALGFYEHFGFKIISRSELDGTGKPYPILHMELGNLPPSHSAG